MEFTRENITKFCQCDQKDRFRPYLRIWIEKLGFPYVINQISNWFPEEEAIDLQQLIKDQVKTFYN